MKMRKILSYLLVVLMLATVIFSASVTSSAQFDSDKVVVSSFSTMSHNYTKSEGWYNDIGYWGEKTPVSNAVNSDGSLTMSIPVADYNYFRQVMTNWQGVTATTETAYIDITNNSTKNLRVIITVGGYTTPAEADLPKVLAGSTKTVELGVLTGGSFNIMIQEQYGGDLACGDNLYTLSPIYTEPAGEEEETTVPTEAPTLPDGYELVYPFESANHNYSKSEGCNPNNNWAWGSFASTSLEYIADGSVSFDLEAGAYNKFRQFQSNWRNVPAEACTTYIDITNNTSRTVKARVTTPGYTTPSDANLPQVKSGETVTIELGALNGGSLSIMLLDLYGSDEIPCGEDVFTFSGIYKEEGSVPIEKYTLSFKDLEFSETITSADGAEALTVKQHLDGSEVTALTTSRSLVEGDKLDFVSNASVPAGKYKVDLQYRAYTGRAQLDITLGDCVYETFTSASSGGTGTIANLFEEYVHSKEGSVNITFDAVSSGSIYIEALILTKVGDYEPTLYEVTVDGATEYVEEGAEFALPTNDSDAFIGYYLDEKVYSPGESVTVNENLLFESLYLDLSMESGASFRLANPTGIRFYTNIDKEQLETLENYGATVQLGTLIAPEDYLETEELTFELAKFADVKFNTRTWFEETDFSGFVGSIVRIREGNINRGFVGRGYATVTIGEITKTVYANYADDDRSNNTRSICFIADKLLNSDNFEAIPDAYKEIVEDYASKYVE